MLLGDAGNDTLVGGKGRNLLIGGIGLDRLTGGSSDDVLVGGRTDVDSDDDALFAVLMAWNAVDSYENRAAAIDALMVVFDDGVQDKMTGSSGRDLFYAELSDQLTDRKTDEFLL